MRKTSIWKQIWEAQGRKCADCKNPVELHSTHKRSNSFDILCKECYEKLEYDCIIIDEAHEMSEEEWRNLTTACTRLGYLAAKPS